MNKQVKRVLISLALSVVLMALLFLGARTPSNGPTVFSLLCLPFFLVGKLFDHISRLSGEIAFYSSMFLFFFTASFVTQIIWSKRSTHV